MQKILANNLHLLSVLLEDASLEFPTWKKNPSGCLCNLWAFGSFLHHVPLKMAESSLENNQYLFLIPWVASVYCHFFFRFSRSRLSQNWIWLSSQLRVAAPAGLLLCYQRIKAQQERLSRRRKVLM